MPRHSNGVPNGTPRSQMILLGSAQQRYKLGDLVRTTRRTNAKGTELMQTNYMYGALGFGGQSANRPSKVNSGREHRMSVQSFSAAPCPAMAAASHARRSPAPGRSCSTGSKAGGSQDQPKIQQSKKITHKRDLSIYPFPNKQRGPNRCPKA